MLSPVPLETIEAALLGERQFVMALGGHTLSLAGGELVANDRIPVSRFNFIQELRVGVNRQASFFERALDHYFQRALRPSIRVPLPVPLHIDRALSGFGFRLLPEPCRLLIGSANALAPPTKAIRVRNASPEDLDLVVSFWTDGPHRAEFRRALEVLWNHPNPEEELTPMLAFLNSEPVSAALAYRYRRSKGVHFVSTRVEARGQGAASQLVREVLSESRGPPDLAVSIFADTARLERRLRTIGFEVARSYGVYELPLDAELSFPSPGPPSPPRWRPPRR